MVKDVTWASSRTGVMSVQSLPHPNSCMPRSLPRRHICREQSSLCCFQVA